MIKRTQSSKLDMSGVPTAISSDMQPLKTDNVQLQYNDKEWKWYNGILDKTKILKADKKDKKILRIDVNAYRKTSLVNTWLSFDWRRSSCCYKVHLLVNVILLPP
jgi:hypothetical protein